MSNTISTTIVPFRDGDFRRGASIRMGGVADTDEPTGTKDLAVNNNTLLARKPVVFARFSHDGVTKIGITTTYMLMWSHYGRMPYIPGRNTIRARVSLQVSAAATLKLTNSSNEGTVAVTSGSIQTVEVTCATVPSDTSVTYLWIKADSGTVDAEVFTIELTLDPVTTTLTTSHYIKEYTVPTDTTYYGEYAPLSVPFVRGLLDTNRTILEQSKKVVSSYFAPFSSEGGSLGFIELGTLALEPYTMAARILYFRRNAMVKKVRVRLSAYTENYTTGDGGYIAVQFRNSPNILEAYLPFDPGSIEDIDGELDIPNGYGPHELVIYGRGDSTDIVKLVQWVVEEV